MIIWFVLQESPVNLEGRKYLKFFKKSEQWLSSWAVAFLPDRVHTSQRLLHILVEKIILQICVFTFLCSSFRLLLFRGLLSLRGNIKIYNKIKVNTFQDVVIVLWHKEWSL